MKKKIIYNAVPAFEKAPAAMDILAENLSVLIQDMQKREAEHFAVILPKKETVMAEKIESAAKEAGLQAECILASGNSGFVYLNDSAVRNAAEGEKPLPTGKEELEEVVQIAELTENGSVYVELPDGKTVKEAAAGTAAEILEKIAGNVDVKAVYVGHPYGQMLTLEDLDSFVPEKGCYLRVICSAQCMLDEMIKIANEYRQETCGRCVFGHEGSAQIQMIFSDMALKKGKAAELELLLNLCDVMRTQSLCEVGSGLAGLVQDVVCGFRAEIEAHITKKSCPAGVCSKFLTYHILPEQCTGCNECVDECEEDAILGRKRFIHVIDQDECIQCGACLEACDEGAIVKAGAVKPRCPKKPIPCKRR